MEASDKTDAKNPDKTKAKTDSAAEQQPGADKAAAAGPGAAGSAGPALGQPGAAKDKTGRASGQQAYGEATRDKVKGSPYQQGSEVVAPGAVGAGYDKTKAGIQAPKPGQAAKPGAKEPGAEENAGGKGASGDKASGAKGPAGKAAPAPLPTVPAATVEGRVVQLLSYDVWAADMVVTDDDAAQAYKLIGLADDKGRVFQKMREAGVYDRLWSNLPKASLTENFPRTLSIYKALPENEKLSRTIDLLRFGLTDWAVDARELRIVNELLASMGPAARQQFLKVDNGVWYARLIAQQVPKDAEPDQVPDKPQPSLLQQVQDAMAPGKKLLLEIAQDPSGALEKAKEGGRKFTALVTEGKLDLDDVAKATGGSLGGMKLDEKGGNAIDMGLDTEKGVFDVQIPSLAIKAIDTFSAGTTIQTGGGVITGVKGQVKWATPKDGTSGLTVDIAQVTLAGIHITARTTEVLLPLLALHAVHLSLQKPLQDQAKPTTPGGAADLVGGELVHLVSEWTQSLSAVATVPQRDPDTIGKRLSENLGGMLDYEFSLGNAVLQGLQFTQENDKGEKTTTTIGLAKIAGISASLEHKASIALLRAEQQALLGKKGKGAAELDRMQWLEGELATLEKLQVRATELTAKEKKGLALTVKEQDELIRANNRLTTGVVKIKVGLVEVRDSKRESTQDGKKVTEKVGHAKVEGIEGQISGSKLGGHNELTSEEKKQAEADKLQADGDTLDYTIDRNLLGPAAAGKKALERDAQRAAQAKAKDAERKKKGVKDPDALDGMFASFSAKKIEGEGIDTADVDVASLKISDAKATGAQDAAQIKVGAADVAGLDGSYKGNKGSVDKAHLGGADLQMNGSDVGGYVDKASVDGVKGNYGKKTVDLDHAGVQGVRGDANLDAKKLRSGSIEHGDVDGLTYKGDGTTVKVATLDADGLSAKGVTSQGAQSVGAKGVAASNVSYGNGATQVSVDGIQAQDVQGRDLDAGKTDKKHPAKSTSASGMLDVAGVQAQGIAGSSGASGGKVASLEATGLKAKASADGSMSGDLASAKATGIDGHSGTSGGTVDSLEATGLKAKANADGSMSGDLASAKATGIAGHSATADGKVDSLEATGLNAKANADGSMSGDLASAKAKGIEGHSGTSGGTVDSLEATGLSAKENTDGSRVAGAASAKATGIEGHSGTSGGTVDSLEAAGLKAKTNADGSVLAGLDSAKAKGIDGHMSGAEAKLGEASVGKSRVALNDEHGLDAASAAGLDLKDLRAKVIPAKKRPSASGAAGASGGSEAAGASGPLHLDALGTASGVLRATIPLNYEAGWLGKIDGIVTVVAKARDGRLDLEDIDIQATGLAGFVESLTNLKVIEGKGLVARLGFIDLKIWMDSRDYKGLASERQGGSDKGSLFLEAFAEGMMNPEVAMTQEGIAHAQEVSARAKKKAERRTAREARAAEHAAPGSAETDTTEMVNDYIDVGRTQIDISGLKLGNGQVGHAGIGARLDDGGDKTANRFEISTKLGKSATVKSEKILAKDLVLTDMVGAPAKASALGIEGLQVDVLKPLANDRQIKVGIKNLQVTDIQVGDQKKLAGLDE